MIPDENGCFSLNGYHGIQNRYSKDGLQVKGFRKRVYDLVLSQGDVTVLLIQFRSTIIHDDNLLGKSIGY